jgi:hypothetical protein
MIVGHCALAISQANTAGAQKREPNETEKALAVQIKCEDFAKNSDGGWTSAPNVRIGATELGGADAWCWLSIGAPVTAKDSPSPPSPIAG